MLSKIMLTNLSPANENTPQPTEIKIIKRTEAQWREYFRNEQTIWDDERQFSWENIYYFYPTRVDQGEYGRWRHECRQRLRNAGIITDESTFGRTIPGWPPSFMPEHPQDIRDAYPSEQFFGRYRPHHQNTPAGREEEQMED